MKFELSNGYLLSLKADEAFVTVELFDQEGKRITFATLPVANFWEGIEELFPSTDTEEPNE